MWSPLHFALEHDATESDHPWMLVARILAGPRYALLGAIAGVAVALIVSCSSKKPPVAPGNSWRVEGTLRYEDGRPAPTVYVNLTQRVFPETGVSDPLSLRVLTDAAGIFRFEEVTAGYFALHASGPGDILVAGASFQLGVASSMGELREIPLTLHRAGTFSGTAQRQGATHHEDTHVLLDGAPLVTADTDVLGRYVIRGVPAGQWTVLALSPEWGFGPDSVTGVIAMPGDSVRLRNMLLRPLVASGLGTR